MIIIKNTPRQPKPEDVLRATAVLFSTAVAASLTTCVLKKILIIQYKSEPASNFNKSESWLFFFD